MILSLNTTLARITGLVACVAIAVPAAGQINDAFWVPSGTGSWTTGANWSPFGAVPDASFNEVANIINGGTAQLNSNAGFDVGGVNLGSNDDLGGALEILSGGVLSVISNGTTDGAVTVGNGTQAGSLVVERGGALTAERISSFPAGGDSSVVLGGGAGAGTANVSSRVAFFRSPTRLIGSGVSLSVDQLAFDNSATLTYEVNGTGNSVIDVAGPALLAGALELDFDGVAPSIGDSWMLIDSELFVGDFIDVRSADTLPAGSALVPQRSNGGSNGSLLSLSLEETLTLRVNRVTGQTSLHNDSGLPVSISGYSIGSPGGSLNTGYESLADQSIGAFQEATPSATLLSELSDSGSTAIDMSGFTLAQAYTPVTPAFGTAIDENLTLNIQRGDGLTLPGVVEFVGEARANNLVLLIDPATGDARLLNDSSTDLSIDVYSVASDAGALQTTWNSLEDQGLGAWAEANPSANRLSELEPTGELALNAFDWVDLNGLWDTVSGVQDASDLTLTFRDVNLGEFDGVVQFRTLTPGREGDYNADGVVDAADYTVWRDNEGTNNVLTNDATPGVVDESDYLVWVANFGLTGPAGAAIAVPEPSTLTALLGGLAALFLGRRGRNVQKVVVPVVMRSSALAALVVMTTGASAQTTITGADIDASGLNMPFTDGSVTVSPFAAGGAPGVFAPGAGASSFIGVDGGSNANGIDDLDGDPLTTADQERLDIALNSGFGLTGLTLQFSRAYPIRVSGFTEDPLAFFANGTANGNLLVYDETAGDLLIYQRTFSGVVNEIGLLNSQASDNQTLSITAEDLIEAAPQAVLTSITYDTAMAPPIPGDVDGSGDVTLTDFGIIRDNFGVGVNPSEGDLTRDGAVDLSDFAIWEANFAGDSSGLAQILVATPEPTSAALAAVAGLAGLRSSRRRGLSLQ